MYTVEEVANDVRRRSVSVKADEGREEAKEAEEAAAAKAGEEKAGEEEAGEVEEAGGAAE